MKVILPFLVLLASASAAPNVKKPYLDLSKYQPRRVLYPQFFVKPGIQHKPRGSAVNQERKGNRIVGGIESQPHAWPFMVGLLIDSLYLCAGQIISKDYVMTAGHCADGADSMNILAGAHDWTVSEPTQVRKTSYTIKTHEKFNPSLLRNDIALIRLEPFDSFVFTPEIQPVDLPNCNIAVGTIATVMGWGLTDSGELSPTLREATDNVIRNDVCNAIYGIVVSTHVCLGTEGGHGTCSGDSGGPLWYNGATHGVTSFTASDGCNLGFPDGFTRVYEFLDWIEENSGVAPSQPDLGVECS